jgi:hypothetical protein
VLSLVRLYHILEIELTGVHIGALVSFMCVKYCWTGSHIGHILVVVELNQIVVDFEIM